MEPRLRQVVLAAHRLEPVLNELVGALTAWTGIASPEPYRDPGVAAFGLENAVVTVGDTFVEIVSPTGPGTAVGRHLERHGGDSGYMVMIETDEDADEVRARLGELGVRTLHESSHPDITDLHLHPKDVPGALVAVDVSRPPGPWRWAGPAWTGGVPEHAPGGVAGLTVAVPDPDTAARRWALVAGLPTPDKHSLAFGGGVQRVAFVPVGPAPDGGLHGPGGITEIALALPARSGGDDAPAGRPPLRVGDTTLTPLPLPVSPASS
jgi:hypothetical protein